MTIGTGTTSSTGRFDFHHARGSALVGYWVYNTASTPTTVTTVLTKVSGPARTVVETVPAFTPEGDPAASRPHKKLILIGDDGVRSVEITSSNGAALKILNFVVLGPP